MVHNQIKNIGISIFSVLVIGYSLILNFSRIGLAGAAIAIGTIFLVALANGKEQSIVEKIDLYILFSIAGILMINSPQLLESFSSEAFMADFEQNLPVQLTSLIFGFVIGLILSDNSKKRKSLAAKTILKFLGLFFTMLGISSFLWAQVFTTGLVQLVLIFSIFSFIAFCRANRTTDAKAISRVSHIAVLLAILSLALPVFFPAFSFTAYNIGAFLSIVVLPWYSVLGITLVLMSIVGLGVHHGKSFIDEDTLFLTGIVGLVWVAKAAIYFYFDFSWIAICVYALLYFGFTNRFVKRKASGVQTEIHFSLANNEFYWLLIAAVSVVATVVLFSIGYIYFWLSLIIGLFVVLFLHKSTPTSWIRDAIFWISLLFGIAGAACMISLQTGYSSEKITMIAALFTFASISMWMLNHKNSIGQNKFIATKVAMVLVFALLATITAFKGGANISIVFEEDSANVGVLVLSESDLMITATPKGSNNEIVRLSYVWTDSFFYDEDDIVELNQSEVSLSVENKHLIIWVEDTFGVITRKNRWFYDAYEEVASVRLN